MEQLFLELLKIDTIINQTSKFFMFNVVEQ